VEVKVRDGDVMKAYRKLKKKLHNEGVIQDLMDRKYFVKPSVVKRLKRKAAVQRQRKEMHKQMANDGK
jgi:ribosomal protein S21